MKKIILFLALLSLGVSKAQVVGGYLPVNSTKSATMGGLRVNGNETVTGTFSVGSTATITGALKASSTMSLGSANLTGGNTGTVAVLSDALFPVTFCTSNYNPADGSTYYMCNINLALTAQGSARLYIPYNVTLVGWTYNGFISSTSSSAETTTLSIGVDNSFTNLNTSITYSVAGGINTYSASGLSQNINSGSYIEGRLVNPTWATNPAGLMSSITFWFVRRS